MVVGFAVAGGEELDEAGEDDDKDKSLPRRGAAAGGGTRP